MFRERHLSNEGGGTSTWSQDTVYAGTSTSNHVAIDGEQLVDLLVSSPLDLSVFQQQPKRLRGSESPLDLSVKTRKRNADSTDEESDNLRMFYMPANKKNCSGNSRLIINNNTVAKNYHPFSDGFTEYNKDFVQTVSSKNSEASSVKREYKPTCNMKDMSVIRHGSSQTIPEQHGQHNAGQYASRTIQEQMLVSGRIAQNSHPYYHQSQEGITLTPNPPVLFNDKTKQVLVNEDKKTFIVPPVVQYDPHGLETKPATVVSNQQREFLAQRSLEREFLNQRTHSYQGHGAVHRSECVKISQEQDRVPSSVIGYYAEGKHPTIRRHGSYADPIQRCSPDSTMIAQNSPKHYMIGDAKYDMYRQKHVHSDSNLHIQHQRYQDEAARQTFVSQNGQCLKYNKLPGTNSPVSNVSPNFIMLSRDSSPSLAGGSSPSIRKHSPTLARHLLSSKSITRSPTNSTVVHQRPNQFVNTSHANPFITNSSLSHQISSRSCQSDRPIIKGTVKSHENSCSVTNPNTEKKFIYHQTLHQKSDTAGNSYIPASSHSQTASSLSRTSIDRNRLHHTFKEPVLIKEKVTSNCNEPIQVYTKDIKPIPTCKSLGATERVQNRDENGTIVSKIPSCVQNVNNSSALKKDIDSIPFSSPLSIAIPGNSSGGICTDNQNPIATTPTSTSRPYSRKQMIMNAVKKDECLKKIVNSSLGVNEQKQEQKICKGDITSAGPMFSPPSPNMPRLSPQQKLSPAMISPLIGGPPSLDMAAAGTDKSKVNKMVPFRRNSFDTFTDQTENRTDGQAHANDDIRHCRLEHSILSNTFNKRTGFNKNIPVANVSPMVHGHCAIREKPKLNNSEDRNKLSSVHAGDGQKKRNDLSTSSTLQKDSTREGCLAQDKKLESRDSPYPKDEVNMRTDSVGGGTDSPREIYSFNATLENIEPFALSKIEKSLELKQSKSKLLATQSPNLEDTDGKGSSEKKTYESTVKSQAQDQPLLRHLSINEIADNDDDSSSPKSPTKASNIKLKADEIRRRVRNRKQRSRTDRLLGRQKWIGRRKRKKKVDQKGFIDFQPEVMVCRTRTRTQAASTPTIEKYHRNAAYEKELTLEENRNAQKRHDRLRQNVRRLCHGIDEKQTNLLQKSESSGERESKAIAEEGAKMEDNESGVGSDSDSSRNGMWEVRDTSSALKQTLRNGKSKGGLMMKLLFTPQTRNRFCHRRSSRLKTYHLRRPTHTNGGNILDKSANIDLGKKLEGARRRGQAARQRIGDKKRKRSLTDEKEDLGAANEERMNQDSLNYMSDDLQDVSSSVCASTEMSWLIPMEIKKLAVCRDTGETVLHRAARMGYKDIAQHCVLVGKMDVNARDNAGYTALHESCVSGNLDIAFLLLSHKADVNCSSQDGIRPIHDAVENDNVELVRMLLTFGADPTLSTYGGKTPLKIARSEKMRKLLEGHLGDLNAFSEGQEQTVWDVCRYIPETDNIAASSTNIFSNLPSDPEEEDLYDELMLTDAHMFTCFDMKADDTLHRSEQFVLLQDITEYLQVSEEKIRPSISAFISDIQTVNLRNTSYNNCHPERLDDIQASSCDIVAVSNIQNVLDKCKQISCQLTEIDAATLPHKFKHYKCLKSQSLTDNSQSSAPTNEILCADTSRKKLEESTHLVKSVPDINRNEYDSLYRPQPGKLKLMDALFQNKYIPRSQMQINDSFSDESSNDSSLNVSENAMFIQESL